MKEKYRNFNSKLHMACSNDPLKPTLQLIHFKNKKAYATDGMIAIRQPLNVHSLFPEDIDFLEGKFIHQTDFKKIITFENIRCSESGIFCQSISGEVFFPYYNFTDSWVNIDQIFEDSEVVAVDEIAFNAKLINNINHAFVGDNKLRFLFNNKHKATIVRTMDGEQEGILMPVMIQ